MSTIAELKLIVDSSDLKEAKKSLEEFNVAASKVEGSSKKINTSFEETTEASSNLTKAQQRLIAKATEMVETFDKGQSGVLSYRAGLAGVGDVVDPLVKKFDNLKNTQKETEAVNKEVVRSQQQADAARLKLIAGLQEEIALFGKSKHEIALYRAEQLGILDSVTPLVKELNKLKEAKEGADKAGKSGGDEVTTQQRKLTLIDEESKKYSFVIDQKRNLELINENILKQEQRMESSRGSRERAKEEAELNKTRVEAQKILQRERAKELSQNKAIQAEFNKLRGSIDPVTGAYEKLYEKMDQIRKLRKQVGKVSGIDAEELNNMEDAVNKQLKQLDDLGKTAGKTAKEMAFAMRGLPAQFTDIVVSLQGGQRPMTVLLQQGGQIKDMFGGIVPAFKAMGSYALGLINPLTVLGATVGVLGYSWYSGKKEAEMFNKTMLLTGQTSRYTNTELRAVTEGLANNYTTMGKAAEVINKVVAAGNIHKDNLETVARATIDWSRTTGAAVDDVVDDFSSLAKDPVSALDELEKKYKFLTIETYEAAKAQIEMGNKTEATRILTDQMASTMESRSKIMVASLNPVDSLLYSMKNNAMGVVSWFKRIGSGTVTAESVDIVRGKYEKLAKEIDELEGARKRLNKNSKYEDRGFDSLIQGRREELSKLGDILKDGERILQEDAERPFLDKKRELDVVVMANQAESVRLKQQLAELDSNILDLGKKGEVSAEYRLELESARAKIMSDIFKAEKEESGQAILDEAKDRLELTQEQFSTEKKIGANQKLYIQKQQEVADLQEQINSGSYTQLELNELAAKKEALGMYEQMANLEKQWAGKRRDESASKKADIVRESAAEKLLSTMRQQEASLEEQLATDHKLGVEANKIARLKERFSIIEENAAKRKLTEEEESLLKAKETLLAQQQKNTLIEEEINLKKQMRDLESFQYGLDATIKAEKERLTIMKGTVAMSDRMADRAKEIIGLDNERAKAIADLQEEARLTGNLETEALYKKEAAIKEHYENRKKNLEEYYEFEDEKRGNWESGMASGLENFLDQQLEMYETMKALTEDVLTTLSGGVSKSLAQAIMYGEDFGESMRKVGLTIVEKVVGGLIDVGIQQAINFAKEKFFVAAIGTAKKAEIKTTALVGDAAATKSAGVQAGAAATTATAWSPAAMLASIGSFGAAAAVGLAGVLAAMALTKGFRKGGYTGGGGVDEVAGVVHGKEYVFDAESTARIGVKNLEKLRNGGKLDDGGGVSVIGGGGSGGGLVVSTNINITAGNGVSDEEARRQGELAGDAFEARVLSIMSDQQRAGGMLSTV